MKKIYLVLLAPLIIVASCKKDHSPGTTASPANYQLVGYASYIGTALVDSIALTYDLNSHLLNNLWNIYFGGAPAGSTFWQLVYVNGKVSRVNTNATNYVSYYDYHYNGNNAIDTVRWYTMSGVTPAPATTWAYAYNTAGQISDEYYIDANNTVIVHYTFTYDASGNLSQELANYVSSHPVYTDTFRYSHYDNKVNVTKAVPGYPLTTDFQPFELQLFSSPNNYGTVTISGYLSAGGQYAVNTTNYSYRYNAAGLPTQIVNGIDTIRLTYQTY